MRVIYSLFCLLPLVCFASPPAKFIAGTDYEVLKVAENNAAKSAVSVVEFFNYGCPWCFHLEKNLEDWVANKPSDVDFQRVPVAFNASWDVYAKTYYVAQGLGVEDKIDLPLFKTIHEQGRQLTTEDAMAAFFVAQGVSKQAFDSAYNRSPAIDAQVVEGKKLVQRYAVYGIPAFVVAGKYKTDSRMNQGDAARMINVLNFLIEKARQEKQSAK